MISITNTIASAIAFALAIAIAIISISPRPNERTYGHNQLGAGTRFRWNISIGDLLSPSSNCLPLLRNLMLRLSTPQQRGIVGSCQGGRAEDKVQTMISTDVMIQPSYAAHHVPHTTCHMPPTNHCPTYATCLMPPGAWCLQLTPPGAWLLQLSKSLDRACRIVHVSI